MKFEHKEPKIGLSIKNKSGKRKLSRDRGLMSKTPSDPCVNNNAQNTVIIDSLNIILNLCVSIRCFYIGCQTKSLQ